MEASENIEVGTRGKISIGWRWPLVALVVVFLAVALNSKIGFFLSDPYSLSFRHQGSHKNEKLKVPPEEIRKLRNSPPSSYSVKFESFKTMMDLVKDGYYESHPFTVGGDKDYTYTSYVSLYARIDDSNIIDSQVVYAEIKFFVYNYIHKAYYYYQDLEPIMFHSFETKRGVKQFLPTAWFTAQWASYGYISKGGECVFGIDIFVAPPFNKWENFSFDENISNPVFNWNITYVSTIHIDPYTSDPFSSGGRNWVLKVYPNGYGIGTDNSLSLYLLSESNGNDYVRAKLRVLNQYSSNHVEKQVEGWSNVAENGWGFDKFISLSDLEDRTKGFVVNDLLEVEVTIMAFSKTNSI
ncbi:hypothetical protein BRARA_F01820 [Brassica rapa]|uniref:MATH domain-containing protein n=1 Tax=Brassica campestris TaxID=3711 RepID=A0A397Z304_BRACM|nr:hypothetical protein BRARA_F01820 [Brassica rapa]